MAKADSSIPQIDKGSLKRVLGVTDLFAVGYGDLGSSIFYALGVTALFALGATPIALMLAGLVFVCTALSYAEMTAMLHESGGSASFARHAFNDLISFVAGWGLLLDYVVTIAISAFTIGPYLASFFPILQHADMQILFAIAIVALLFLINYFGVKQSTRISFILMAFTIATQCLIVGIGVVFALNLPQIISQMSIGVQGVSWSPSWHEFLKGTAMAMVAYTGIESIAQLGAESRKPARTVPRAIIITMFVLVAMYLGISTVGLSVISATDLGLKYTQDPIAGIVGHLPIGGAMLLPWVAVLAAVVLFVASNAGLIGASRLSFNMGEYYQLPRFFYVIHPKHRTPFISLALFALAASIIIALSHAKMSFLADLYNFGAQIAFFSTHMSLIVLRIKKPMMRRPFKVPLNIRIKGYEIPVTAILGALSTLSVWLLVVVSKPDGRYLGFAWMALGLVMYLSYRKKKKISATAQVTIEHIKVPEFQSLSIKHILLPVRSGTQTETVQVACELAKFHGAELTAIHVLEVPFSIPLDTPLAARVQAAGVVLKIAEAIARDYGIDVDMQVIRARSVADAILDLLRRGTFDLIVLGALQSNDQTVKGLGAVTDQILKESPCRVLVCGNDFSSTSGHKDIMLSRQ